MPRVEAMALYADLMVNGERIGNVYARRVSPPGWPGANDVCEYEWRIEANGVDNHSEAPLAHRYGDGPWALIARIIQAAGRGSRQATAVERVLEAALAWRAEQPWDDPREYEPETGALVAAIDEALAVTPAEDDGSSGC